MATPDGTLPATLTLYAKAARGFRKYKIGTVTVDVPVTITSTGRALVATPDGGLAQAFRQIADQLDAENPTGALPAPPPQESTTTTPTDFDG